MNRITCWREVWPIVLMFFIISPSSIQAQRIETDWGLLRIKDVFTFEEVQKNNKFRAIDQYRGVVDINAAIRITPVSQKLTTFLSSRGDKNFNSSTSTITFSEQRTLLLSILEALNEQVKTARHLVELSEHLRSASPETREVWSREIQAAGNTFDSVERRYFSQIQDYLTNKGFSEDDRMKLLNDILPRGGNYQKLASFIDGELVILEAEIQQNVKDIYATADHLTVQMGAFLIHGNNTTSLHLPGYDSLQTGIPHLVQKVSLQVTEEQQQRLNEEFAVNKKIAEQIQQMRTDGGVLRHQAERLKADFLAAFDSLITLLPELKQEGFDAAQSALQETSQELAGQNHVGVEELRSHLDSLRLSLDQAQAAYKALKESIDALNQQRQHISAGMTGANPADALSALLGGIDLQKIRSDYQAFITALDAVNRSAKTMLALVETLRQNSTLSPEFADGFVKKLETVGHASLVTSSRRVFGNVLGQLRSFNEDIGQIIGKVIGGSQIVDEITPGRLNEKINMPVSLTEVPSTTLDLIRTGREEGDFIQISIQLKENDRIIDEQDLFFRVKKVGFVTDVSGGVAFISAFSKEYRDSSKKGNVHFVPTPLASFILKYQPRESDIVWLGAGIHTTALDFDPDVPVELGFGASLHLVNNIMQIGLGYNPHADKGPWYWFLGLGVFDLFRSTHGKQEPQAF